MRRTILVSLSLLLLPATVLANAAVPSIPVVMGTFMPDNGLQWFAITMFMCISTEGLIYHYAKVHKHPYLISTMANFVTFIAGFMIIPLSIGFAGLLSSVGLRGASDAIELFSFLVFPIFITIIIELGIVKGSEDFMPENSRYPKLWIIGANILSNILILGYMVVLRMD